MGRTFVRRGLRVVPLLVVVVIIVAGVVDR